MGAVIIMSSRILYWNKVKFEMSQSTIGFHVLPRHFTYTTPPHRHTYDQILVTFATTHRHILAADHTSADNAFFDDTTIAFASRVSQTVTQATVATTISDRRIIKYSEVLALTDTKRLQPGMYVAYNADNLYSADSTPTYHGLGFNRMQVLISGYPLYSVLSDFVN
jgi:hypothetical protein